MAKQNTKHTRKKPLTKAKKKALATKLEQTVNKVSIKGLFFKTRTKTGDWNIVDGKNKTIVLQDILLVESANHMLNSLNNSNQKQVKRLIHSYTGSLQEYQKRIFKCLNDIMFYKHTLKTTKSSVLFHSTEARVDLSLMNLRHAREELHVKLATNTHHGKHLI
jgi:hypothetical protein